ncbi:MAG: hypothetical protein ABID04_03620 [Patescibacteria group bacterium]
MKKIYLALGLLLTIYLALPVPKMPPTDLPESLKSTDPGDTIQLSNVSAYFTDWDRHQVLSFYTDQAQYPGGITYRLNHPPEYARQIIRDTTQTYYLEEIVHPFKQSLFVNGFEWQNDVFTPVASRGQNAILVDGKTWSSKVTLRWFTSNLVSRVLVFWLAWFLFYLVLTNWTKEFKQSIYLLRTKQ